MFGQTAMTADLWALLAVVCLGIVQLGLTSILSLAQLGPAYILSARDEHREPTGLAGRIARSYRNLLESFAQFVAALLLTHASATVGDLSGVGAWVFFVARLLYVPAYAFGAPGLRPLCWIAGQAGIVIVLADLFVA